MESEEDLVSSASPRLLLVEDLVAIVLLAVGFNVLNLLGVPYWLQPIFNGVVLILAVITAAAEGRQILK